MSNINLDDLAVHIRAGINAVEAIQNTIAYGPTEGEAWAEGLWFVCDTLRLYSEALDAYVEDQARGGVVE
ncbi:MAG: hypothetical protein LUC30_03135 [Clostridiales bacterium]|nr:hypothetical protein [Clostridiales bacterium]